MKRTICEVIDYWGTTGGSFIPSMQALSRAVTSNGDRFVVISSDIPGASWYEELTEAGTDLHLVHNSRELSSALKALRPDIVHSHFNRYDVAVARLARHSKIVWHLHSVREEFSLFDELRARVKYMLIGGAIRQWLCVSGGIAEQILDRGAPKERVRVLPNGIDTSRFHPPTSQERADARARFGIAEGDRVILFFDRTPVKGGSVLRDALEEVQDYRLLLNGGSQEDWSAFEAQHDVIRSPRLADPRPLYWAADAFVLASLGEGFGFVLGEAAACGLPIATSDIPPAVEMLADCEGAFFFPAGDARALAVALRAALEYGPSTAVRERIEKSFSLERWTDDMLRVYESI